MAVAQLVRTPLEATGADALEDMSFWVRTLIHAQVSEEQ